MKNQHHNFYHETPEFFLLFIDAVPIPFGITIPLFGITGA
jgi:hypothetical protein